MSPINYFVKIEDMTWPAINSAMDDLIWKQRYVPDEMTTSEQLVVASVMDAYCALVNKPVRARAKIVAQLKLKR